MNNSRRKWNVKQTNEDKLIRDFYSMACLWGSKTVNHDDSVTCR